LIYFIKAKFHYASWFEAGSKLVGDHLRTSFKPDSVMEFGFNLTTLLLRVDECMSDKSERRGSAIPAARTAQTVVKLDDKASSSVETADPPRLVPATRLAVRSLAAATDDLRLQSGRIRSFALLIRRGFGARGVSVTRSSWQRSRRRSHICACVVAVVTRVPETPFWGINLTKF